MGHIQKRSGKHTLARQKNRVYKKKYFHFIHTQAFIILDTDHCKCFFDQNFIRLQIIMYKLSASKSTGKFLKFYFFGIILTLHEFGFGIFARIFVKPIFFMPFSSVPSLGMDSSVNLGMPRNEHFLPRNNRSHSESIPQNFFGTKFRCQPYF
jgi:hypothetical protein